MSETPSDRYSLHVEWSEEDRAFVATCAEFPGLSAFGGSRSEAIEEAETALELFVEEYKESGDPLPKPKELEEYSGQTRIRMPRFLHAQLSREADRQDVSLNTLMVSFLQRGLGYDMGARDTRKELFQMIYQSSTYIETQESQDSSLEDYDPLANVQSTIQ